MFCGFVTFGFLCCPFAGAEHSPRFSQTPQHRHCSRMRGPEHAPRGPFQLLEILHCLVEIVERGAVVNVEGLRVDCPHFERQLMRIPENPSRYGCHFAQQ